MSPTDAERESAMRVMAWDPLPYAGLVKAVEEGGDPDDREALELVDAIAQALADQRTRYDELADELERDHLERKIANRIRSVGRGD